MLGNNDETVVYLYLCLSLCYCCDVINLTHNGAVAVATARKWWCNPIREVAKRALRF